MFLDVQPLVNAVYERGPCEQVLDYGNPLPEPAMAAEDVAWCEELLHRAALRP